MHEQRSAIGFDREGGWCDARLGLALGILGQHGGHILGLHLNGLIRARRPRVEQHASPLGFLCCLTGPEVWGEECDRSFEVAGVDEQRPRLIAGGDVFASRRGFGRSKRQWQIAITKKLPTIRLFAF